MVEWYPTCGSRPLRGHAAVSKTKYKSCLVIEKELRTAISSMIPQFEQICAEKQAQQEMKKYLSFLLEKIDGLICIVITDRDGVPILHVSKSKTPSEFVMKPSFISTFGKTSDQGSKLGLGKNMLVISIYSSHQVIQLNKLPMVVTFIASQNCNTGHILTLEKHLDPLLNDLKSTIVDP